MGRLTRIPELFLFFFLLISLQIVSAGNGDQGGQGIAQNKEEKPLSLSQFVAETFSASQKFSWDKFKSIINGLQLKLSPPSLDFKRPNEANTGTKQEGEKVKEAAIKSTGVGKIAVEESAKSAANAVYQTAEKVKETVSAPDQHEHDEL